MSLRLVCDHCQNVILDAEFREERRAAMQQDPEHPEVGQNRSGEVSTRHFHSLCADAREAAATGAVPNTPAQPVEASLPPDHPLVAEIAKRRGKQEKAERDAKAAHTPPPANIPPASNEAPASD